MPLIFNKSIISDGYFLIWSLEETIEELEKLLPEATDCSELETISHPQKIREWLAGRHVLFLLCRMSDLPYAGIRKDADGKPHLVGSAVQISLSHSRHYIAAVLCRTGAVGLDIERPNPKMARIASKFLTAAEQAAAGDDARVLCVYWCAKEAVFKLNGKKGLSFREHIFIAPFDVEATRLTGSFQSGGTIYPVHIQVSWLDGYCSAIATMA